MHRDPQPVKLYTVAPMYRYAAPQRGRYREHWQCSVEAIGSADPAIDAEVIQLYTEFARRVGITEYELQLNSIGDAACRPAYVEKLAAWLDHHADVLDADARAKRATNALRVFDVKSPAVREALRDAPRIGESLCVECAAHFAEVRRYLDAYGVPYTLEPTLVRGLDYYTRTVFEFVGPEEKAQSAICSGGRYDGLVEEIGGPATPGIGFGAGIERALLALEQEGVTAEGAPIDVFFALDGGPRSRILALMAELRRGGLRCDADYAGRSLKGQLTQAGRTGARTVVVARAGDATVRRAGEAEVLVGLDDLLDTLSR
jgi:histidyl-tRNA synthetase